MLRTRGIPVALLVAMYALLAAAPVALALLQERPLRNAWRELSSALVMAAFAMLLMEFVLSGRWRVVSGRAGIDATMRFHQLAARVLLVLVVAHPLLYAVPRLQPDPANALAALQGMFGSPRLRSGVVAWWLLIALVLFAIFRDRLRLRYEAWRLSHGVGATAVAALALHHTLQAGTYARDSWSSAYWSAMAAAALGSLAYVYLVAPLVQLRHPWRVVSNRQVADRMWEVVIEPQQGLAPAFAAGQFAWLNFGRSPFSLVEHPFSISSAPAALPRLSFVIKESGDFTRRIGAVPSGTRAFVDGPHGSFTLQAREERPLAFIAGGVGFAPILGMLRDLRVRRYPHAMRLVYGNRTLSQILYREEVDLLGVQVDYVLSEPPPGWTGRTGELTPEVLAGCLDMPDRRAWLYFVCGPTPMMDSVERTLRAWGIPPAQVVAERFKYA